MKIEIRPWRTEDTEPLARMMNNPKVQDNLRDGIPFPYTAGDAGDFIAATLSADPNMTYARAVTVDGVLAGSVGVFRKDNVHRLTGELGYYIAEEYWGKGVMTEAVRQMCRFLFEQTDIIRIFAEPFAYNAASCRVLEKAGFAYEGTLRNNAVKNGRLIDMRMYAILK